MAQGKKVEGTGTPHRGADAGKGLNCICSFSPWEQQHPWHRTPKKPAESEEKPAEVKPKHLRVVK